MIYVRDINGQGIPSPLDRSFGGLSCRVQQGQIASTKRSAYWGETKNSQPPRQTSLINFLFGIMICAVSGPVNCFK